MSRNPNVWNLIHWLYNKSLFIFIESNFNEFYKLKRKIKRISLSFVIMMNNKMAHHNNLRCTHLANLENPLPPSDDCHVVPSIKPTFTHLSEQDRHWGVPHLHSSHVLLTRCGLLLVHSLSTSTSHLSSLAFVYFLLLPLRVFDFHYLICLQGRHNSPLLTGTFAILTRVGYPWRVEICAGTNSPLAFYDWIEVTTSVGYNRI